MFGRGIKLFSLFGFEVKFDLSWLIIAILIVWSLSTGLFPMYFQDLSTMTYIWMGIAGAIGLFFSIVFHEFSHSFIARKYGIPMRGITLFIFGGVAEMHKEPDTPRSELYMAVAGPAASVIFAIILFGFYYLAGLANLSGPVQGVIAYLGFLNLLLAAFNLIPAFPLDGGRILRAVLWHWKNNLKWATRVTSTIGSGFGIVLVLLGIFSFISGNFVGGVWWVLIGLFLRSIAQRSYQQMLLRKELEGEPIRNFMKKEPVTVATSTKLNDFVEDYIYRYQFKMFPVTEESRLVGCINLKRVKEIPREEWSDKTVGDITDKCSDDNTVSPETDAVKALSRMNRTGNSRLIVTDGEKALGVISLKDMMNFLSLKVDLEEA